MTADIEAEDRVAVEIARLPRVFRLRSFPGDYFRASPQASYINDNGGVTISLQLFKREDDWTDHSESTLWEILRDMLEISGDMRFASNQEVDLFLGRGEQPDLHLQELLEEGPLSVSRIVDGGFVFGIMEHGEFVPHEFVPFADEKDAEIIATAKDARMTAAMASMCELVRQEREHDHGAEQRRVAMLRKVAERVKASYEEEVKALNVRIDACLLPVEPLRLAWNVFRLFDVEHEEIRWTQWFAAILRPESGERCARVAWRAFCEAVARRAALIAPSGDSDPPDQHHWRDIVALEVPTVEDEVSDGDLGTLDLLITTPSIVAAVENKLWADWHDGLKAPQADRYRKIAQKRLAGEPGRRLGLVLLSQRQGVKPGDYPSDYVHVSWRDVGWALRDALRREWSNDQQTAIDLWPIILTLVSIEQDLLGLSVMPSTTANRSIILKGLSELATYLEGR